MTSIRAAVAVGRIEAFSLLTLFFVAMPIKYFFHDPSWVRLVGSIHGGLFLVYACVLFLIADNFKWSGGKTFLCLVASSLPFGFLWIEKQMIQKN